MIRLYFTSAFLLLSFILFAQTERVISGQLKSTDDGSPLPGVNVVIKGTTTGTVTDADGRYSLSVPIGSVLVFSFIGMQTREVLVTETGLQPVKANFAIRVKSSKQNWNPSILDDTGSVQLPGVATLTSRTPSYKAYGDRINPSDIVSVRRLLTNYLFNRNRSKYVVNTNSDRNQPKGIRFQVTHATAIEEVGKLPSLQSVYSQGRNVNGLLTWQGPDQSEMMSWGPMIKTLEYTGNSYAYDRNGTLATAGNGNGKIANSYDPYSFFKTGLTNSDEITLWFPGLKRSTASIDFAHKNSQGVVPRNQATTNNFSFSMKGMNFSQRMKADASFLYNSSEGRLMNRGSNISNLIGSMMMTAPTFDISNGYGKNAVDNFNSYQLTDGSVRSSAPGIIDNPYGLVNRLPDHENVQRVTSTVGLNYVVDRLKLSLSGTLDNQSNNLVNGVFPGYSGFSTGRRTEREEQRNDMTINFLSAYRFNHNYKVLNVSLGYQFRQENRSISRIDGFGYSSENFNSVFSADSLHRFEFARTRNVHELVARAQFESYPFDIQFSNRSYFSNTINTSFVNLFPSLTIKAELGNLIDIGFVNELKPFVSVGRSIRESPLLYGSNSSLSTQTASSQYNRYFENQEIIWHNQLKPETEVKFETGLHVRTYFNLLFEFAYYNNTTFGMIMPVWNQSQPVLQNVGTVNNRGTNASISYSPSQYYRAVNWGITLRWTKYNSVVTQMNEAQALVSLAGFNNIQTAASKGQVLGAIYGTTFLRDERGRMIIGADGFPQVDSQLKVIGNPIPQFLISLEPYLSVKQRFKFSFVIDFKKGGQVWNGTKAALNYLGRSQESADQRTIANYVFDGITSGGSVNTVPVSFYDPSLSLQQNRWVRYGMQGVGEEHIEDASWIRLNEVSLSYKFFPAWGGAKKELSASFIGKNLFLITPYSGVDPGTSLFGYGLGQGLDLFNAPSLRSYSFLLTLKF